MSHPPMTMKNKRHKQAIEDIEKLMQKEHMKKLKAKAKAKTPYVARKALPPDEPVEIKGRKLKVRFK